LEEVDSDDDGPPALAQRTSIVPTDIDDDDAGPPVLVSRRLSQNDSAGDAFASIPEETPSPRGAVGTRQGPFERSLLEVFHAAGHVGNISFANLQDAIRTLFEYVAESHQLTEAELARCWPSGTLSAAIGNVVPSLRRNIANPNAAFNPPELEWVELFRPSEGTFYFSKRTGVVTYEIPDDLVSSAPPIEAWLEAAVVQHLSEKEHEQTGEQTGLLPSAEVWECLLGSDLGLFLSHEFAETLVARLHDEDGKVPYAQLASTLRADMIALYATEPEPVPNDWCYMHGGHGRGFFWYNKKTGLANRITPVEVLSAIHDARLTLPNEAPPTTAATAAASTTAAMSAMSLNFEELKATNSALTLQLEGVTKQKEAAQAQLVADAAAAAAFASGSDTQKATTVAAKDAQLSAANALVTKTAAELKVEQTKVATAVAEINELKDDLAKQTAEVIRLSSDDAKRIVELTKLKTKLKQAEDAMAKDLDTQALQAKIVVLEKDLYDLKLNHDERGKTLANHKKDLALLGDAHKESYKDAAEATQLRSQLHETREVLRTTKVFLASKSKVLHDKIGENEALQIRLAGLETRDERRGHILDDMLARTAQAYSSQVDAELCFLVVFVMLPV